MSTVELEVHMDCPGCRRKVRKALSKLEGVETIDIDMETQKVSVTGSVDQMTVLDAVRSTGKKAQFWPYLYNSGYYSYASQYNFEQNDSQEVSTYSYELTEGYNNGSVHGYYHYHKLPFSSSVMDDKATSLFSDDNPHACSVM